MRISHKGMFNAGGTPFALAAALRVGIHQAANFQYYKRFGKRTANQGEIALAGAGDIITGIFVDVSQQGDSCTVETQGYEWVNGYAGAVVGDIVTAGADGKAAKIAGAVPTLAEFLSGCYVVDEVNGTDVHINLSDRL